MASGPTRGGSDACDRYACALASVRVPGRHRTLRQWHGMGAESAEYDLVGMRLSATQRIDDMMLWAWICRCLSPQAGFYQYDRPQRVATVIARECNDSILAVVEKFPERFLGVGTVPLQDIDASINEVKRIRALGLKGIMIGDHVCGSTYEEERFLPLWAAVENWGP